MRTRGEMHDNVDAGQCLLPSRIAAKRIVCYGVGREGLMMAAIAMRLMHAAGLHPIPAATGYALRGPVRLDWRRLVPNGSGARKTEHALHEFLGLIAIRLGVA